MAVALALGVVALVLVLEVVVLTLVALLTSLEMPRLHRGSQSVGCGGE